MSNNPQTWSDYGTAVREAAKYSGIGFMFSGSGFFGVDIDDCRDAVEDYNDGGTDNIVHEFIYGLCSYAELSQSGNGIHIICNGSLPNGARRRGKVEMYDKGRFFIMTGNICSEFADVADCTEAVKPLHKKYLSSSEAPKKQAQSPTVQTVLTEQEIISKAMSSHNGEKFSALYNGDISGFPSQSEADLAFCNMLAFWCGGDTELMDSIYRSSGLMRDKWDRKQSGSTYKETWLWLKNRGCEKLVNKRLLESYSLAFARFIQCEDALSTYGLLGKHPTTGGVVASPFASLSQSYQKQANLLWYEIFDIVKQNCTTKFDGSPQDDMMEQLLRSRK